MVSKREKLQNNLWYMREQLVRYLHSNYGIKTEFKFYGNKQLKKQGLYIKTTLPEKDKWDPIEIDVCADLLMGGKKKLMLDTAFKEAVRIGQWFRELPYKDGHPEFEEELRLRGLTGYNATAETGLELHQYGCSACKKVYVLKKKKLSAAKCPETKGFKSMCCHEPIKYFGVKFFKSELLQRIKTQIDIGDDE